MVKRVLRYTSIVITSIFFLSSLYIMVFGTIARKNNTLLNFFGYSYSAVPTASMEGDNPDSIDAGSFIVTKKTKYEDIVVGDIIVFKQDNILVVHRVVEINEEGHFVTKGDNNNTIDNYPVTKDTYVAKTIKSYNFYNLGSKIGNYQLQILFTVIIILVVFVIYQIFVIFKTINDDKLERLRRDLEKERVSYEK